jgi:hypothetical protein
LHPSHGAQDHRTIIAKSCDVYTHYQWVSWMRFDFPDHGRFYKVSRDKRQRACGRELTAHPGHKKAAVLGVILCPLRNLLLVTDANVASIDMPALPTVREPPKALAEWTNRVKRIAEHAPNNLGVHVSHHWLDRLPDDRRDYASFVHNHDYALALVVQAREPLRPVFIPRQ